MSPVVAPPRRAALAFIFVTVVLDVLALGLVIPVLPKLVETFLGGDTAAAARVFGVFGTVWAAMQFVFSPLLGALSDRFGRRPVILISNFGLGIDYILMALAPSLAWLFVGRVISGIVGASWTTAAAYLADVTKPEERAANFGRIGAAWGLGFVLGPALGGVLGGIDPRLPFWVAAVLTLLNACYGLFVLPESLPRERRGALDLRKANPLGSLRLLRGHRGLLALATVAFLFWMAHQVLSSTFVLYTSYRYDWSPTLVGLT
ncbi:MAG: MFS transporter, partial [Candidatus Eisenbacteria bacterium]